MSLAQLHLISFGVFSSVQVVLEDIRLIESKIDFRIRINILTLGPTSNFRQLLERVIHMNFSAKKMKFFFKKYLDFEEKYGTEEDVAAVKQKAVEYVQTKAEVS